jgi:hypothetical protein
LHGAKIKHNFDVDREGYRRNEFTILYDMDVTCKFTIEDIKEDYLMEIFGSFSYITIHCNSISLMSIQYQI